MYISYIYVYKCVYVKYICVYIVKHLEESQIIRAVLIGGG